MRSRKWLWAAAILTLAVAWSALANLGGELAEADTPDYDAFKAQYPAVTGTRLDTCGVCHADFSGGGNLNAYGTAYLNAGNFTSIATLDSDGDGTSNVNEISALFMPGLNCTTYTSALNAPAGLANYVDPARPACTVATPTPVPTASPTPSPTPTPAPVDSDGDGVADQADNCPNWPNAAQNLPLWTVPASDPDCDGFATAREQYAGTDPAKQCPNTATVNDEPVDAWPSDFNDSRLTSLADVVLMGPVYNQSTGTDPAKKRFDLNASGIVSLADVVLMGPFYNKSCA